MPLSWSRPEGLNSCAWAPYYSGTSYLGAFSAFHLRDSRCTLGILSRRFETTKLGTDVLPKRWPAPTSLTTNNGPGVIENPCQTAHQTLGKVVLCPLSPRNRERS